MLYTQEFHKKYSGSNIELVTIINRFLFRFLGKKYSGLEICAQPQKGRYIGKAFWFTVFYIFTLHDESVKIRAIKLCFTIFCRKIVTGGHFFSRRYTIMLRMWFKYRFSKKNNITISYSYFFLEIVTCADLDRSDALINLSALLHIF